MLSIFIAGVAAKGEDLRHSGTGVRRTTGTYGRAPAFSTMTQMSPPEALVNKVGHCSRPFSLSSQSLLVHHRKGCAQAHRHLHL